MEHDDQKSTFDSIYQSEIVYNQHLPYASIINQESDDSIETIKLNLSKAIITQDLRPGVVFWSRQLTKYIKLYGLKFSKEDHIKFVHLYYQLLTIPDIEGVLVEPICNLLLKLIKKKHLLSRHDLTLDWRVLQQLFERFVYSKWEPMGLEWVPSTMDIKLRNLIKHCRHYFTTESTQEMLDEWLPLLCPYDVVMDKASRYLALFLPTLAFDEHERQHSWNLWKDQLLELWISVKNGPNWEKYYVNLFARLASLNVGHIDWTKCIDPLFTRVLRSFHLPVGKLTHTTALARQLPLESCANWIVWMLGGRSSKLVLDRLRKLLNATESYFHPSNSGKWVNYLTNFMLHLIACFVHRIERERFHRDQWQPDVPDECKIKKEEIEEFVQILKPAAMMSLFSKMCNMAASRILQLLSSLRPDLILPEIIDKTYMSLTTLTEPHQVRACLSTLTGSLHTGIRDYPECRKHILPLLFQSLPGLDPNDLPKCMITFQFISTCLVLAPAIDCSSAVKYHDNLDEDERELCFATSQFEDFVLQYIDRCLMLVESLREEHGSRILDADGGGKTQHENISKVLIVTSTAVVLQQCSRAIYTRCLQKLFQFSTSYLLEGSLAVSVAASLFAASSKVNPEEAFALFIPYYCEQILNYFSENPDAAKDEKVDRQLQWDLQVLSKMAKVGTSHLVTYKDSLFKVASYCLKMSSKDGYELAGALLKCCIVSWTTYYTIDSRSVPHSFDQDVSSYLAINDWGFLTTPKDLQVRWHTPSELEITAAFEAYDLFLEPILEKLTKFSEGSLILSKEELLRLLSILYQLAFSGYALLPVDRSGCIPVYENKNVEFSSWDAKSLESLPFYHKLLSKYGGLNLRRKMFDVAKATLQQIKLSHEDNVKAMCMIINIFSAVALLHEQQKATFNEHWKVFIAYKSLMKNQLYDKKCRDRFSLIDRVTLQHEMRVLSVDRSQYTSMFDEVLTIMLDLSLSHYMKVRGNAQAVFFHALSLVSSLVHKFILPPILQKIDSSNSSSHQEFKGALYLLAGKAKSRNFLAFYHKWEVMSLVWPALVAAPHSDKKSINKLYDKLAMKIQSSFSTLALTTNVPSTCVNLALDVAGEKIGADERARLVDAGISWASQRNDQQMQLYTGLVKSLIDLYESGKLSWKYEEMTLGMLSLMLRKDVAPIPRLTKLFVGLLLDDALSVRQLSIACVASIMKQLKRPHVSQCLPLNDIARTNYDDVDKQSISFGDRADNEWHQYNPQDLPDTEEKFTKMKFIDKTHWGYYVWPKTLKTYAPYDQQPNIDRVESDFDENEMIVYERFTNPEFVEKLIRFLCLENVKGRDKFDTKHMDMFRGLFRNFGDTLLSVFKPHIERLVNEKHESDQRCVAELITGIVMGAKHWPFSKLQSLWSWLIPLLRTAVFNISNESRKDWDFCFSHIVQNRDPRRIHWILDFLVNEPKAHSPSALVAGSKLYVLQGGIHQQEWRCPRILEQIIEQVEPLMGHPYKSMRCRVGSILASIFLFDISLKNIKQTAQRTPQMDAFIERLLPRLEVLLLDDAPVLSSASSDGIVPSTPTSNAISSVADGSMSEDMTFPIAVSSALQAQSSSYSPSDLEQIQDRLRKLIPPGSSLESVSNFQELLSKHSVVQKLDDVRMPVDDSLYLEVNTDDEKSEAIRVFKTAMKWVVSGQRTTLQPFHSCLLKLLPFICKLYPIDKQGIDEELHFDTRLGMSCFAQCLVPNEDIPQIVDTVQSISGSQSWHARYSILPYIQVFVYNNIFAVHQQQHCVATLKEVIIRMLRDEQPEVSNMACLTLSGLLQCKVIALNDELLQHAYSLCKTKLSKKRKRTDDNNQTGPAQIPFNEKTFQTKLLKKHAGVLLLSACVLSHPYTVPEWLPGVVMRLANVLHDPQPIHDTVKRTLSEFRRTHHDNWHEDKLKFDNEELAILTDLLVSPSYYA